MATRNSNGKPRGQTSLIPAVGYIRMSTDRQEHSPERQRAEIIELAERDGYHIIKWYEDHGLTGTESANRPEFQRLLQDASHGRFQTILLYEQSRFSREDIFDVMLHWRLLRQAGVDIVTCQRGRLRFDDLGGILTAIIDQHGAREESMKLAQRVVKKRDPTCPHPVVWAHSLEVFVLATIRTRLLEAGAEEQIRDAIIRMTAQHAKATSQDEKKLQDIRRKIDRGTENLALAGADDFAAISKLLERWREEEAGLLEQLERRQSDLKPLPEALRVIERFAEIREKLDQADRVKLKNAIQLTLDSITIGTRKATVGGITFNEFFGELRFCEGLGIDEPIPIPDEAIGHRKIWREIGVLARTRETPLRLADVCQLIESADSSHASYHLRRAVLAGVVRKLPNNTGWVAAEPPEAVKRRAVDDGHGNGRARSRPR